MLAATNRLAELDGALLRAGRFDRKVLVEPPDVEARGHIFALYARRLLLDVDARQLGTVVAHATAGKCGADLELIANEAALLAADAGADAVGERHIQAAVDSMMSPGSYEDAKRLSQALDSAV